MKKIISLALVFIVCLSTLTYADYNWDNIRSSNQKRDSMQIGTDVLLQLNIIGKTNEGFVVVRDEGIDILSFVDGGTGEDPWCVNGYKDLYELVCNSCGKTWKEALEPWIDVKNYVREERCPDCDSDRLNFHYLGAAE